jgi:hypothetical protein
MGLLDGLILETYSIGGMKLCLDFLAQNARLEGFETKGAALWQ